MYIDMCREEGGERAVMRIYEEGLPDIAVHIICIKTV